jgi:hypothetical protein
MPQSRAELKGTLRDRFAGAALTGMCANPTLPVGALTETIARWAWEQADAMLAKRGKTGNPKEPTS